MTETAKLKAFIADLLAHLDYIGWGDAWEREVSEDLRKQAAKYEATGEL